MQITVEGACVDRFEAHKPGRADVYTFVLVSRFIRYSTYSSSTIALREGYLKATVVRSCGHLCEEEFRAIDPELDWYSSSPAYPRLYCCFCHPASTKFIIAQCCICEKR